MVISEHCSFGPQFGFNGIGTVKWKVNIVKSEDLSSV